MRKYGDYEYLRFKILLYIGLQTFICNGKQLEAFRKHCSFSIESERAKHARVRKNHHWPASRRDRKKCPLDCVFYYHID